MARFQKKHRQYHKVASSRPALKAASAEAQSALVEVMTIAACVDGMLEEGEARALAMQILATPGFSEMDNHELARHVQSVAVKVAAEGITPRVHAIAQAIGNDVHTREEAFALATLFVLWDGEVGDEEQEFLNTLQKELHLSDERASHITALLSDATESDRGTA